jgi:hypothetical protein
MMGLDKGNFTLLTFGSLCILFGCHGLAAHKEETTAIRRKNVSESLQLQLCTESVKLLGEYTVP